MFLVVLFTIMFTTVFVQNNLREFQILSVLFGSVIFYTIY